MRVDDGAEHPDDRDRTHASLAQRPAGFRERDLVERRDLPAVELMPAADQVRVRADRRREVDRPVRERRHRRRRGETQSHDRGRREVAPLDERVREVRRADHDGTHLIQLDVRRLDRGARRRDDPFRDLRRRRHFRRAEDLRTGDDDRVRVRPADVDAEPKHRRP